MDREGADWVLDPRGLFKKANLIFVVKFIWLLFRHYLSPTAADNILTWDKAVLVVTMVAGFVICFSKAFAGSHP